jgi:uncharacterized protein (DUF169 family)
MPRLITIAVPVKGIVNVVVVLNGVTVANVDPDVILFFQKKRLVFRLDHMIVSDAGNVSSNT